MNGDCKRCGLPIDPRRALVEFDDGSRAHAAPEECIKLLREAKAAADSRNADALRSLATAVRRHAVCNGYVETLLAAADAIFGELLNETEDVPAGIRRAMNLTRAAADALGRAWHGEAI